MIDYNNKSFKLISTSKNSEVSEDLIFVYKQQNNVLSCSYSSTKIVSGNLLGLVKEDGEINFFYHQITKKGKLMSGKCKSTPIVLKNGKIRLYENWEWTSGDFSKGNSIIEEI